MKRSWISFVLLILAAVAYSQESRIEKHTISSAALGIDKDFYIYLPEDYDASSDHYPALYLFRGYEYEWVDPLADVTRQGNIKTVADSLYRSGQIGKMIIVMPGLTSKLFSGNIDVQAGPVNIINVPAGISGLGTGRFEDYLVDDLIPFVDANFRTIPSRWSRGADGFSFGGFCSMSLATRHPELISSVGSFDGVIMWLDLDDPSFVGPMDDGLIGWVWFDAVFGKPRNIPFMMQFNFASTLKYADPTLMEQLLPLQYLITTGPFYNTRFNQFVGILGERGMKNKFNPLLLYPSVQHTWFWADYHMYKTLPLHWSRFQHPQKQLNVNFQNPSGGTISGNVQIAWSRGTQSDTVATTLAYSKDGGRNWNTLLQTTAEDSTYTWNTTGVADGARYVIMVTLVGDSAYGLAWEGVVVDNPGNGLPDAEIVAPISYEVLKDSVMVKWITADAENDPLSVTVQVSPDGGTNWQTLGTGLQAVDSLKWHTRLSPNSENYRMKLSCSDGTGTRDTVIGAFSVRNSRVEILPQVFQHVSGNGDGIIKIHKVDAAASHQFRITFDDTSSATKTYDVYDLTSGSFVVENATELDGITEGPEFNGMRLVIYDLPAPAVNTDSTRWVSGTTSLFHTVILPTIQIGPTLHRGAAVPFDYEIRVTASVADTSSDFLGATPTPMKFTVWNITENRQVDVVYVDTDGDNGISSLDAVYILEKDLLGQPMLTWEVEFSGAGGTLPTTGAVFRLKTKKPFTSKDVFEFTNPVLGISADRLGQIPGEFRLDQNFPNPFNPSTEIRFTIPYSQFTSLKIYDLLGREVMTLVNEELRPGTYSITWDATGFPSGVYFYRLASGSLVETKKLVLIR